MGKHNRPRRGETPDEPEEPYQPDYPAPDDYYRRPDDQPSQYDDDDYPEFEPPAAVDDESQSGRFSTGGADGGHRSTDGKRRGISIGVIVALITVVVLVAGVILWRFFGNVLSDRTDAAAACRGPKDAVAVIADPAIADQITEFAGRYNRTAGPIGDRCVEVGVKAANSDAVINGFDGDWPTELGARPALWIPASSVSTARLRTATDPNIITDSQSLVSSPVLLAIRPQLKIALDQQNWGTLPALQTNPISLEALNMPGWGSLRLALPITAASDASYLAAEAVAAAAAPEGGPVTAGAGAVNTLIGAQPKLPNDSASTALDTLLQSGDPAVNPVHAVVITEQQLYQRATNVPDAKNVFGSWLPPGPTAIADFPMAQLDGDWVTREQSTAADEFSRFLRKPEQLADLASAGFRADGGAPPRSDVTTFPAIPEALAPGDDAVRTTLADTLTSPSGGAAATIMLDQSMPANEGGTSRLANVVAALKGRIAALPPTASVGLWTFDGVQARTEVPTGPLADPLNGQPRSAALTAVLDRQFASGGGAVSFTTLRMIYDQASANFRPNVENSVLVITTGPHTDQSLDGPALQDYVKNKFDPARPVAINVIDFGDDPDRATWAAVAQLSGGSYQNLTTSASPELSEAITTFLA